MKIVVTTPTGQIGHQLVRSLIRAGERPTVIARDPAKLGEEIRPLVEVVQGDSSDSTVLDRALANADAFFFLTPPEYTSDDPIGRYRQFGQAAADSAARSGVARVVHLSSGGAERRHGMGLIDGAGANEEALEAALPNVVHLRPGFFFENFVNQVDAMRRGQYYANASPDLSFPYVATRDIAEVAAGWLLREGWVGRQAQGVNGPEDLTFARALAIISEAVGREIQFVQIPDEAVVQSLVGMGASEATGRGFAQMFVGFASYKMGDARSAASTTPTRLGAWAYENLRPLLS